MNYETRIQYIEQFMQLLRDAETYQSAASHSSFVRGVLAAYFADLTLQVYDYQRFHFELEEVMEQKYKLDIKQEGVSF